jgi:hypothetical protein
MRTLAFALGASLVLVSGSAHAVQTRGTVEQVDRIASTITVDGDEFGVSGTFSVPSDALENLNEGDEVVIQHKRDGSSEDQWYSALQLDKVG